MKKSVLLAFLLATAMPALALAQGDPKIGQQAFNAKLCRFCHGENGEGGFGPDLAGGRGLTLEQFRLQIRKPWGVMLSYTERQLSDEKVADIFAFLQNKPKVAQPAEWHWVQVPDSAPLGQRLYMNVGCAQCHEP